MLRPEHRANMDNFKVCVISHCKPHLELALRLLWNQYAGPREKGMRDENDLVVTHFQKTKNSLCICWSYNEKERDGCNLLPVPLDFDETLSFIMAFLKSAEYGPEPDHDGSNSPGFRISNNTRGIWTGDYILVQPEWSMQGK